MVFNASFPNLLELVAVSCSWMKDSVLQKLSERVKNLEAINVSQCDVTDGGISALQKLSNLQRLILTEYVEFSGIFFIQNILFLFLKCL